jgi:WD40 repeat protein
MVRIWDLEADSTQLSSSAGPAFCWAGHTSSVISVAFSPDGQYVLSGSRDGTVRIWDFKAGQTVRTIEVFEGQLNLNSREHVLDGMVLSPKGDMIVVEREAERYICGKNLTTAPCWANPPRNRYWTEK